MVAAGDLGGVGCRGLDGTYGTNVTHGGCLFSFSNIVNGQLLPANANREYPRPRFENEYENEPLTANPEKRLEFAELRQGLPGVDQLGR